MFFVSRAGKKPRSDCLGKVNFTLGQVKKLMEVRWSDGQVNLASVVLLVINPNQSNTIAKLRLQEEQNNELN